MTSENYLPGLNEYLPDTRYLLSTRYVDVRRGDVEQVAGGGMIGDEGVPHSGVCNTDLLQLGLEVH